jgi:hypothetical protein
MKLDLICVQFYASMFVFLVAPDKGQLPRFVGRQKTTEMTPKTHTV